MIPKEYIATDEEDGNAGFYRKVTRRGKDDSSEFVKATIYQEDDDYYYVDMDTFQDGDVILKPDSQSVYEIKEKKALEGVYCINKGYAVFRKIVMIEQNDGICCNYRILFFIIGPMIIAIIIFTRSAGMNGITQTARAAWKV